jgi:hypothetical protein
MERSSGWEAMGAGRKVVVERSCGRWNAVVDGRLWVLKGRWWKEGRCKGLRLWSMERCCG